MKRKLFLLAAIILSLSILLAACGKKDNGVARTVGEEKGKEAGLALINQVFDANATEAEVKYKEYAETSFINGAEVQTGLEAPLRLYSVTIEGEEDGDYHYHAEVNAVTGVAYRAERSLSSIVLTEEQKKQTDELGSREAFSSMDFAQQQQNACEVAQAFVEKCFAAEDSILRTETNNVYTDSEMFPLVELDSYIIMKSGTTYNVTICWPVMEVVEISMSGTEK